MSINRVVYEKNGRELDSEAFGDTKENSARHAIERLVARIEFFFDEDVIRVEIEP